MRSVSFAWTLIAATLTAAASAQLVNVHHRTPAQSQSQRQQLLQPINNPALAMPPIDNDAPSPPTNGQVILSDVLGLDRTINVFAGLVRDIDTVAQRIDNGDKNTTVLAPLNSAITSMPRKPWEDPEDYDKLGEQAYVGDDGVDRAHNNLKRFVESHVIQVSPWREGEKVKTMAGQEIWWEEKNGVKVVQPGEIEVSAITKKVANGEVWILKAARKP